MNLMQKLLLLLKNEQLYGFNIFCILWKVSKNAKSVVFNIFLWYNN